MQVQIIGAPAPVNPPVPEGLDSSAYYLGRDAYATYWLFASEVYSHRTNSTSWLCSYAAWSTFCRINPVTT